MTRRVASNHLPQQWLGNVDFLVSFVHSRCQHDTASQILIYCGHVTSGNLAMNVLTSTKSFRLNVLSGKQEEKDGQEGNGETSVSFKQDLGRFALLCPLRLSRRLM